MLWGRAKYQGMRMDLHGHTAIVQAEARNSTTLMVQFSSVYPNPVMEPGRAVRPDQLPQGHELTKSTKMMIGWHPMDREDFPHISWSEDNG